MFFPQIALETILLPIQTMFALKPQGTRKEIMPSFIRNE